MTSFSITMYFEHTFQNMSPLFLFEFRNSTERFPYVINFHFKSKIRTSASLRADSNPMPSQPKVHSLPSPDGAAMMASS